MSKQHRFLIAIQAMVVLLLWAAHPTSCYGWSARGHGEITLAAYQALPAKQKTVFRSLAAQLVKSHKKASTERAVNSSCTAFPAICFLGFWPDTVRDVPLFRLLSDNKQSLPKALKDRLYSNTASWHYNNAFYSVETKKRVGGCTNTGEIIAASEALKAAFEEDISFLQRAVILSMLVHLAADAHQPMHAVTGVGQSCNHDRGGNAVCYQRQKVNGSKGFCEKNLHQLWDQGAGLFKNPRSLTITGQLGKYDESHAFRLWLAESAEYASEIYSFEDMTDYRYQKQVQQISRQRAKIAAYRIASLVHKLLKQVNND